MQNGIGEKEIKMKKIFVISKTILMSACLPFMLVYALACGLLIFIATYGLALLIFAVGLYLSLHITTLVVGFTGTILAVITFLVITGIAFGVMMMNYEWSEKMGLVKKY